MTIVEFLKARLAEDEAVARAIDDKQLDSGWSTNYNQFGLANTPPGWYITPHIGLAYEEEGARHIVRHDPARVLREVAAKRAIISDLWSEGTLRYAEDTGEALRALAAVYSDHPDFDLEWAS